MKITLSPRYTVLGVYQQRRQPTDTTITWHLYPVPFVRVTLTSPHHHRGTRRGKKWPTNRNGSG